MSGEVGSDRSRILGVGLGLRADQLLRLRLLARNAVPPVSLILFPCELAEANAFVELHHRHHKPVIGHKFSLMAGVDDKTVGVAIVGRPVARGRDDGITLEVTRLCTDGTKNACSFLYGACARAAFALGYKRIGTYILASESGASLKACGWRLLSEVRGRSWSCDSRPRVDKHPLQNKLLYEATP